MFKSHPFGCLFAIKMTVFEGFLMGRPVCSSANIVRFSCQLQLISCSLLDSSPPSLPQSPHLPPDSHPSSQPVVSQKTRLWLGGGHRGQSRRACRVRLIGVRLVGDAWLCHSRFWIRLWRSGQRKLWSGCPLGASRLLPDQRQGLRSILSPQLEFSSGLSRQRGPAADKSLNALVGHH